ncbi:hypothetical protein [Thiosocius teredinicola]|uniref:hypothetical protein n=1 Tax=Thiosocius teredinicola TaxID=1973002 RepID=UPI000990F5DD
MKLIENLSVAFLAFAILAFLSGFYYHQQYLRHDDQYSQMVSKVTSALSKSGEVEGVFLSAPRGMVTEDGRVPLVFGAAVILASIAVAFAVISRKKHGKKPIQLPVIFGGTVVVLWVIYMANFIGLLPNA